jgi:K+/H+ antiporter YhaU regulatory subunit KhtT
MIAIISLLVVLTLSILITRIATVALTLTGLSKDAARFQARSAFTGVGFTTDEAEKVVNHPPRRQIILLLMLLGNAGIVTAVSSLILSFLDKGTQSLLVRMAVLSGGIIFLWVAATNQWLDRHVSRLISSVINRYTRVEVRDYSRLLRLSGDYGITELHVDKDCWLVDKKLGKTRLRDEGIVVLGITRQDGKYLGAPDGSTEVLPNDNLVIYGRSQNLKKVDERRRDVRGDQEHDQAVLEQRELEREEKTRDARR